MTSKAIKGEVQVEQAEGQHLKETFMDTMLDQGINEGINI